MIPEAWAQLSLKTSPLFLAEIQWAAKMEEVGFMPSSPGKATIKVQARWSISIHKELVVAAAADGPDGERGRVGGREESNAA
jgi:hypothetical protein